MLLNRLKFEMRCFPARWRRNLTVTMVRLNVGAIAYCTVFLISFYALQIWQRNAESTQKMSLTRMIVQTRDVDDQRQRLSETRIAQMTKEVRALVAYPNLRVAAEVRLINMSSGLPLQNSEMTRLESASGKEPEYRGGNLLRLTKPNKERDGETKLDPGKYVMISEPLLRQLSGDRSSTVEYLSKTFSQVMVRVRRNHDGAVEYQDLSFPISGITRTTEASLVVTVENARTLDAWQTHRIDNPYDLVATLPATAYSSAVFYAPSIEAAPVMAREFERLGFKVVHQLAALRNLQELSRTLMLLVLALVAGALLSGMMNFVIVCSTDLLARRKEIGIKFSYGIRKRDLILATSAESLCVTILASLAGCGVALLVESTLTTLICKQLGLPLAAFSMDAASMQLWWLHGVTLLTVIVMGGAGILLPMWRTFGQPAVLLMKA